MLRHPYLYRRHVELAFQLYSGKLSPRDRELVILRVGWLCKAPYEWGEHVKIGKRVGLTQEEIERATRGSTASAWGEHDRAIVRAAEELHQDAMISDETWKVLSRRLDEQQLIELLLLVGQLSEASGGRLLLALAHFNASSVIPAMSALTAERSF
jgi:alkylhydroperoxidase family enzyme